MSKSTKSQVLFFSANLNVSGLTSSHTQLSRFLGGLPTPISFKDSNPIS